MSSHLHAPHTARRELQHGQPVRRNKEATHSALSRSQPTENVYSYSNTQYWNPSHASSSNNVYSQPSRDTGNGNSNGSWQSSNLASQVPSSSTGYGRQETASVSAVDALTASFQAQVALPSREQVQTYLVQHMKKPLGLYQGWRIEGAHFDIYELFSSVLRAGGSSEARRVTRRDLWPVVATLLHLPAAPGTNGLRSTPHVATTLRKFFLELLGGLEILWDQTRNIDEPSRPGSGQKQIQSQVDSAPHSRAQSHMASNGRYDDRAAGQAYGEATSQYARNSYYGTTSNQQTYNTQLQTNSLSQERQRALEPVAQQPAASSRSRIGTMAPSEMHLHQMTMNGSSQSQPQAQPESAPIAKTAADGPKKAKKGKKTAPAVVAQQAPSPPPAPIAPPAQEPQTTEPAKKQRRSKAEMAEYRAAKALASEAVKTWQTNGSVSSVNPEAGPTATQEAAADATSNQAVMLVAATQEAPVKLKRERRTKKEIEEANAAKEAARPRPVVEYHEDGIAKLADFDALVNSRVLPLPPAPPDVVPEKDEPTARYYAARCQELRTAVQKNREQEAYRELSDDEVHFWNALVSILKHNSTIIIPGAEYFKKQAAAALPKDTAAASSTGDATKKGGRPRLPRDDNGNIIRDPALLPPKPPKEPKEKKKIGRPPKDPNAENRPAKRKPSPERDEGGRILKRLRGRVRADGMAKYVNEDGEISWRPWTAPEGADGEEAEERTFTGLKPLPPQRHHDITAQPFETVPDDRTMKQMMSVFPSNPARGYFREEDDEGQAIIRRTLAFPGSNERRVVQISRGVFKPAKLKPTTRAVLIVGPEEEARRLRIREEKLRQMAAEAEAEEARDDEPAEPVDVPEIVPFVPKQRMVLDSIELGFMAPATLRKFKRPEDERSATVESTLSDQLGPTSAAPVEDQFGDEYDPLPQWEDDDRDMDMGFEPVVETPTRRGTRYNPAPAAAPLAPTPATVRLNKQLVRRTSNGKILGALQLQRSRLSIVSYPERPATPPPPEPRRMRSGLVVESPVAGPSRSRPIARNSRVSPQIVQSEPRRTRSGLVVEEVPSPPPSAGPRRGRNAVVQSSAPVTTPRRTRSGMVIANTPTPPPAFSLHNSDDGSPPRQSQVRRGGRGGPSQVQVEPRRTRNGVAVQATPEITPRQTQNGRTAPATETPLRQTRNGKSTVAQETAPRQTRNGRTAPAPEPTPRQTRSGAVPSELQSGAKAAPSRRSAILPPPEPRQTRSIRSPSVIEVPSSESAPRNRQQGSRPAPRPAPKPKAMSRPVVSFANAARRLRGMKYSMSLRDTKKAAAEKEKAKAKAAEAAATAMAKAKAAAAAKRVVRVPTPEVYEIEDEDEDLGRGIPVIELPTRKASLISRRRGKPRDKAVVVLDIRPRLARAELIEHDVYDPSEDDADSTEAESESDDEVQLLATTYTVGKRDAILRPRAPEPIPIRFAARGVRELNPLLSVQSLLARAIEHPCGWRGCGALLASEELLRRHLYHREHSFEGRVNTAKQTLWRCFWQGCDLPTFNTQGDLTQHLLAKHVAKVLRCPFERCDASSPTVQHLGRHVARHHEGEDPVPLANLTQGLVPAEPDEDLPGDTPAELLAAPPVAPSAYHQDFRNAYVRDRVVKNCFAPDEPEMRIRHPVHILKHIDGENDVLDETEIQEAEEDDDDDDEDVFVPDTWRGRKIPVVELPTVKKSLHLVRYHAPSAEVLPLVPEETQEGHERDEGEWEDLQDTQNEADMDEEVYDNDGDLLPAELDDEVDMDADMDAGGLGNDEEIDVGDAPLPAEIDQDSDVDADMDDELVEYENDGEEDDGDAPRWGDQTLAMLEEPDLGQDDDEGEDVEELDEMDIDEDDAGGPDDDQEDLMEVEPEGAEDFEDDEGEDDGVEEEEEDEHDDDLDEFAAMLNADSADEEEEIGEEEAETDNDSDSEDLIDPVENQVRFDFDAADRVADADAYRLEAYDQVGTPFDLASPPRSTGADEDEEDASPELAATATAVGAVAVDAQTTQDLVRAVQEAAAAPLRASQATGASHEIGAVPDVVEAVVAETETVETVVQEAVTEIVVESAETAGDSVIAGELAGASTNNAIPGTAGTMDLPPNGPVLDDAAVPAATPVYVPTPYETYETTAAGAESDDDIDDLTGVSADDLTGQGAATPYDSFATPVGREQEDLEMYGPG